MRQLVILRMVFDAPCYVDNKTFHDSSGTPYVKDESTAYLATTCTESRTTPIIMYANFKPPPREDYAGDGPLTPCLKPA